MGTFSVVIISAVDPRPTTTRVVAPLVRISSRTHRLGTVTSRYVKRFRHTIVTLRFLGLEITELWLTLRWKLLELPRILRIILIELWRTSGLKIVELWGSI